MDYFLTFLLGVAASTAIWVVLVRRACRKPAGKSAKVIALVSGGGGGGPDPGTP
jgi:hypothetical protein